MRTRNGEVKGKEKRREEKREELSSPISSFGSDSESVRWLLKTSHMALKCERIEYWSTDEILLYHIYVV